jgi:hypothetical protein
MQWQSLRFGSGSLYLDPVQGAWGEHPILAAREFCSTVRLMTCIHLHDFTDSIHAASALMANYTARRGHCER